MEPIIWAAIFTLIGTLVSVGNVWMNHRDDRRAEDKKTLQQRSDELTKQYREDADREHERRVRADALADMHERESDRLRSLLRRLLNWIEGGSKGAQPVTWDDVWRRNDDNG